MIKTTFLAPLMPVVIILPAVADKMPVIDVAPQEVCVVSSFQEAVLLAYMHNVEWKQSIASVHKVHADKWLQKLRLWLPDVSAEAQGVVCPTILKDWQSPGNVALIPQFSVSAFWILFNGFSCTYSYKAANAQERSALYQMQLAEQKMIMQVLEAYCNVWYQRECLKAAEKKQRNLHREWDANKLKLAAGTGTQADVSQAESNYEKAMYEYSEVRTQLAAAEAEFTRVVGGKLAKEIQLPECTFKLPKTLDSLVKTSMIAHPAAYQAEYARISADLARRSTRGAAYPQVEGRISWGTLPSGFKQAGNDYSKKDVSVGVNVKWTPIAGQSGFVYWQQAKAAADVEQQVVAKANVHQSLRKECEAAWAMAQSVESMIRACQAAVKSAETSMQNNEAQRIYGLRSTTENLINENQLLESRQALAKSKVQKVISHYKMIALIGALNGYYIMKTDPKALEKITGSASVQFENMIGAPTELRHAQREVVANVQNSSAKDPQIMNVLSYPEHITSQKSSRKSNKASKKTKGVVTKTSVASAPSA